MAISPFQTKYQAMPHWRKVGKHKVTLRCLTDGGTRDFFDDGPFPGEAQGRNWQDINPGQGRDRLCRAITQRMVNPLNPDPSADPVPVYVWDQVDVKPPRVWSKKRGEFIEPIRMTDEHKAIMASCLESRNRIRDQADAKRAQLKAEEETKATAGVNALLSKLGAMVGAAPVTHEAPALDKKQPEKGDKKQAAPAPGGAA